MELSPEDRARIEAEERYRDEVRRGLSSSAQRQPGVLVWLSVIVAGLVLGVLFINRSEDRPATSSRQEAKPIVPSRAPMFTFVDDTRTVTSGQLLVKPGQIVYFRFSVAPEMFDARLVGRFHASGGTGNDIVAGLFTSEEEYQNWSNGHTASVAWSSSGKKTSGTCDVSLKSGSYILAFSNKHSMLSDKQVFAGFDLRYRRKVITE